MSSIESSNGPFVIGYTLCFGLMGALAVQAYIYFSRFTDDRRVIKAFVTAVLLLETLMTVFVFTGFWVSSGLLQVGVPFPTIAPITLVAAPMVLAPITGVVTTLTHGFYCWRISSLRKSYLVPVLIMMVSLLQLASIVYFSIEDQLFPSNETLVNYSLSYKLSPWLVTWLGSSVVCDLAVTICMILSLRPSKSHFQSNKSTLVKLTRLTIETGLATTIAALLELIIGIVFQETDYHLAVFFAISKLYANCLLASLNFRLVLRNQSDPNSTAIVWNDMPLHAQPSQSGSQSTHVPEIRAQLEPYGDSTISLNMAGPLARKNSSTDSEDQACETYELSDRSTQV